MRFIAWFGSLFSQTPSEIKSGYVEVLDCVFGLKKFGKLKEIHVFLANGCYGGSMCHERKTKVGKQR